MGQHGRMTDIPSSDSGGVSETQVGDGVLVITPAEKLTASHSENNRRRC